MAEINVPTPGGSGQNISADDVSSTVAQLMKLVYGNANNLTRVDESNPLPSDIREIGGSALALGAALLSASLPVAEVANNAVNSTGVTVGTSEVALPNSALANRKGIIVYNNGSQIVYIGPTGVTTSSGTPIAAGTWSLPMSIGPDVTLYGISGTAGQNVRVFEAS